MTRSFGTLPGGETAHLYTICGGGLTAGISDFGATLVSLLAPDREGHLADVVLHAYAQWGDGCVERFNGIFAFAVWEEEPERLFLARDHHAVCVEGTAAN